MLVAVKGNRETKITLDEKQKFIDDGHKVVEVDDNGKQKVVHDPNKQSKADAKIGKELESALADIEVKNAKISELESALADKDKQIEEIQTELKKVASKSDK